MHASLPCRWQARSLSARACTSKVSPKNSTLVGKVWQYDFLISDLCRRWNANNEITGVAVHSSSSGETDKLDGSLDSYLEGRRVISITCPARMSMRRL